MDAVEKLLCSCVGAVIFFMLFCVIIPTEWDLYKERRAKQPPPGKPDE